MKTLFALLLTVASLAALRAQSMSPSSDIDARTSAAPPPSAPSPNPPPPATTTHASRASTPAELAMEHLTRSNQELLDLLKQQQAVLEDIQYDRRLQNRQINLLEQRLEDTLQRNTDLETKVARLEAAAAAAKSEPSSTEPAATKPAAEQTAAVAAPSQPPQQPPPPPASALPPEQTDGPPGAMWWHRLLSLSGTDSQNSDTFHITGKQWRVLWHNQDRPGDAYKNTSALFISAFPKNDTLPKKICSQLGNGGDTTELTGTGDIYLKIEASGGKWELAVEDFR
jgi:hypothetical protein